MCDYEEFELVKKTYYEQGKKSAEKKYSRKIRELEEALRKGKLREEEYEQMLQEERENHQKVLDNLNNSADEMARIDQSEISKQMQDVYRLYEQGEVDKAMEMLARLHLVEGLDQAKIRKERSRKEYQEAVQDSIRAVRNIRSAISLYNYNGDTKNEEILRRTLANRTQTPLELFEYACFCYGVKEYQDSVVPCYKRVMEMTKDSRHHLLSHLYLYATSAYNIGVWYQSRKQIEIANKYLEIGIEERKKYAKQSSNPNDEGHVAWALTGKASGETSNGLFSDAWQHLSEAQEIYDRIVALNPDEHYWALGRLYAYYGDWYRKQGKNEKAEKEYVKAMSIFKEYIDMQPAEYPSYVKYSFDSMVTWLQPTVATLAKHKKFEDVKLLINDIYQ